MEANDNTDFERVLQAYGQRQQFRQRLNQTHNELDMSAIRDEAYRKSPGQGQPLNGQTVNGSARKPIKPSTATVRRFWNINRPMLAMAAMVAIISTFGTLFLFRYYRNSHQQEQQYSLLRRELQTIKKSQSQILNGLGARKRALVANPGQVAGSGFLISADGFLVTNNHIIQDADSVYVIDNQGDAYKAKVVHTNSVYDVAVLQIRDDSAFHAKAALPYGFDLTTADLGERVFTLGYPRDEMVYGEGYLSSGTGYRNDSTTYQIAVSVNPGNSGGPLLDERGNVIGIISGKQTSSEGASFAIKSHYLSRVLAAIPADSLNRDGLKLPRKSNMATLSRKQQIKRIEPFVYLVKVFKSK
jgi:serine protease Do